MFMKLYGLHWVIYAALSIHAVTQSTTDNNNSNNNNDNTHYVAGVVEFRPTLSGATSLDMVTEHLHAFLEIINSTDANETDIIVFPEGALNNALQLSYVPAPNSAGDTPCDIDDVAASIYADFLVQLSCAARTSRKYLVINLTEKENCNETTSTNTNEDDDDVLRNNNCASNGLNVYNTNVVFDRDGRVISRYRKWNIYVEMKNTTTQPEYGIFETDFGVKFGHFICFDMLFYTPAEELVQRFGIKNLITTSFFFSELPFLTAVQLQQSWAWGNNVNLLAAGISLPETGATGTGIYNGMNGALVSEMNYEAGIRKLFVAKVPKNNFDSRTLQQQQQKKTAKRSLKQSGIRLLKDPQIEQFNSILIDLFDEYEYERSISERLCHAGRCCQFDVEILATNSTYGSDKLRYRMGVYNGRRTYEKEVWSDVSICGIYACTNESVTSCGEILSLDIGAYYIFKSIVIEGDFEYNDHILLMPNSLDIKLYSLQPIDVSWDVESRGDVYTARYELKNPNYNLLTFGIYANYYDRSLAAINYSLFPLIGSLTAALLFGFH